MALGDRRSRVRLEVVGALWATLELTEPARLVNISREGALITSSVPMPPESVQPLHLKARGQDVTVDARVRHIRRVSGPDEPSRYLIGVEFLSIPPASGSGDGSASGHRHRGSRPKRKVFPGECLSQIRPDFLRAGLRAEVSSSKPHKSLKGKPLVW